MTGDKIKTFMELAGQNVTEQLHTGSPELRKLGAQLLLSEVLEYVIKGLKVIPEVNGVQITAPDELRYQALSDTPDKIEMIDGLSDTAYTMYWNAHAFGIPLEGAFDAVCDNNLEKFVKMQQWNSGQVSLSNDQWHCEQEVQWPAEVVKVEVINVKDEFYAVGKDKNGKVRKPSVYKPVDLSRFSD
jgi:predicted HAD superfamily Cof-like phosphohydrolase